MVAAGVAGGIFSPVTGWISISSGIRALQHGLHALPSYHFFTEGFLKPARYRTKAKDDWPMTVAAKALSSESDDELMARVAACDSNAFRLLADRHAALPWRIAYRMLADRAETEDIAQEALLRLWQHADRWQAGGSGVAAWLTRVATNACLDRLRRRRLVGDDAVPERADESPLADAVIEQDEVRTAVAECIEALPDRQRAAIVLTYYEERQNQMAAGILNMQLKAFESLLFRARASLRGCVEGKGVAG
jgi:RNA polymerase sigma-70 factor (ECF subfamily)